MNSLISRHFPGAVTVTELEQQISDQLKTRGVEPQSTLWATSLCSDEVSNMFLDFYEFFAGPGPFILGGLSGLPFSGITGMKAFLSHVPEHGTALILYGPHIGLSADGVIGMVKRHNQLASSTCCGSMIAALEYLREGVYPLLNESLDYQQTRVIRHLRSHRTEILEAPQPLRRAAFYTYDSIHVNLIRIVDSIKHELKDIRLLLVGGVVINTDWGEEDYFLVRNNRFLEF